MVPVSQWPRKRGRMPNLPWGGSRFPQGALNDSERKSNFAQRTGMERDWGNSSQGKKNSVCKHKGREVRMDIVLVARYEEAWGVGAS